MATSNTTNFTLDLSDIMEEAFERCGLELRNGYDYQTARRSLDLLMLEWQNTGLHLWTVNNATQALSAGDAVYDLPANVLDVIEASTRTNDGSTDQTDIHMRPISISTYAQQSQKNIQGRPTRYWISKSPSGIALNVWPVPDSDAYTINYYYMKRIEDTGTQADNNMAVPIRFVPPLISGLAFKIALKRAPEKLPVLKQLYDEDFTLAADADRNKATWRLVPGVTY